MSRTVHCQLLDEELEGLPAPPYPGEIGRKIYDSISAKGWQRWMAHQTMLINENRLSPINPDHRAFLEKEMVKFLFEGGSEKPAGYVPPEEEKE
jgi:Fe-S cluster biosynthesis and repair protein YggX